jgi:predicted transcriptional regulator
VFTKKENATIAQRVEILDWFYANGKNQTKTATHFNMIYLNIKLTQPRVSEWIKQEGRWREECEKHYNSAAQMKRARQTEHPEVTKMMEIWFKTALQQKVTLTGELLRQKWAVFADAANVPIEDRLNLSNGWLARFKIRLGLKEYKYHGEAGSADLGDVEREQQRIRQFVAEHGYAHWDIFNMDETGLFYA